MFDKLSFIKQRYDELSKAISDPEVIADQSKFSKLCKEHSDITPIVEKYNQYTEAKEQMADALEMIEESDDKEFREMAQLEYDEFKEKLAQYEEELKILLIPKDPNDDKNVINNYISASDIMRNLGNKSKARVLLNKAYLKAIDADNMSAVGEISQRIAKLA